MDEIFEQGCRMNRRHFFSRLSMGIGGAALASLLGVGCSTDPSDTETTSAFQGVLKATHRVPRARRVIYLFQSGGPSQLELFDYKPLLEARRGEDLPASVRMGQRLTGMTAFQKSLPMASSLFAFRQHGESGAWLSDLLPHTARIADDLCIVRSMYTEAINHDPAITFFQTGSLPI